MQSYTDRICLTCQKPFKAKTSDVKQGRCFCCSPKCGVIEATRKRVRPHEERFWNLVEKTDTCWLWKGRIDDKGYGKAKDKDRRTRGAHAVAWRIVNGDVPAGLEVCHTCSARNCVRPSHLWLGTHKQNMEDASAKNTMGHGENHFLSKLRDGQVIEIRKFWESGMTQEELGRRFLVTPQSIGAIVHNKTWKHLLNKSQPPEPSAAPR